jgi:hypothetical protein
VKILDLFRRRAATPDKDLTDVVAVATRTFGPDVPNLALPLVASLLAEARRAHRSGQVAALSAVGLHLEPKLWALGVDAAGIDRLIKEV